MLVTTLPCLAMAVRGWKWHWGWIVPVFAIFLIVDSTLFAANMLKFFDGGWVPLVPWPSLPRCGLGCRGRMAVAAREHARRPADRDADRQHRSGPRASSARHRCLSDGLLRQRAWLLLRNLRHNEVLHEHVVLLTIAVPDGPTWQPTSAPPSSISARAFTAWCCAMASWSSPTCRATSRASPTRACRSSRCARPISSAGTVSSVQPSRCCRAGSRSCSSCWHVSPPMRATSSACRPIRSSGWAVGSKI